MGGGGGGGGGKEGKWVREYGPNTPHPHPPAPLASLLIAQLARRCTGLIVRGIHLWRCLPLALSLVRVVDGWL